MFKIDVKIIINAIAFRLLKTYRSGTFDIIIIKIRNKNVKRYPKTLVTVKSETIYAVMAISFILGSSRWMTEFSG